jgi:hypothetical protein
MRQIFKKLKKCVDLKNKVVVNTNLNRDNLEFLIGEKPKKIYFLYNYFRDLSFPKSQKVELIPIDSNGKNKISENVDIVFADCFWTNPDNFKSLKTLGSMLLKNQINKINKMVILGWKCDERISDDCDILYNFEQRVVAQELLENYLNFLLKFNNFKLIANGSTASTLSKEFFDLYLKKDGLIEEQKKWVDLKFGYEYFQVFEKQKTSLN